VSAAALAALLIEARRTGRRVPPPGADLVPMDNAGAYEVQEAVARQLGFAVAGWKVGSPNPRGEVSAAPLFDRLVTPSPARFSPAADSFRAVEAELALSLARDLPPRPQPYGEDEAWDAVAAVHVAIELLDSRFIDRNKTAPTALLADNLSNGGFSYGAPVAVRAVDFLSAQVSLVIDGKEAKSATGGNLAGHPRRLLAWLANHAASRGRPLTKGAIVTTGSHTGITIAPPRAQIIARFAGIGEASLALARD
jgi:2-keto-4-pentenoate hydratase